MQKGTITENYAVMKLQERIVSQVTIPEELFSSKY
jgi:hypothetical protein